MGVCPQHDILFDLLTPEEHLSVFIDFKGNESNSLDKKQEIDELIENVGLNEYRNTMAKNLSGGSKRKLSVAIALCGNSKFLLLELSIVEYNSKSPRYQEVIRYLEENGFALVDICDLHYRKNSLIQIDGFFVNKKFEHITQLLNSQHI